MGEEALMKTLIHLIESRGQLFSPPPAACDLLACRELCVGGAGCFDTGFIGEVEQIARR